MNEHAGLLEAICREPDRDDLRLVYADWLEDQGRHERAAFIRADLALAGLPPEPPRVVFFNARVVRLDDGMDCSETWWLPQEGERPHYRITGKVGDNFLRNVHKGSLVYAMCMGPEYRVEGRPFPLYREADFPECVVESMRYRVQNAGNRWAAVGDGQQEVVVRTDGEPDAGRGQRERLQEETKAVYAAAREEMAEAVYHAIDPTTYRGRYLIPGWKFTLHRGFISNVTCPLRQWVEYGSTVVRVMPVTRVEASDREPTIDGVEPWPGWLREGTGFPAAGISEKTTVPDVLFGLLPRPEPRGCVNPPGNGSRSFRPYFNNQEAADALSAACVRYARERAFGEPAVACGKRKRR